MSYHLNMSRKVYELIVPLIINLIVFICFDEQNEWFRNFFIFWIEGFINILFHTPKSFNNAFYL